MHDISQISYKYLYEYYRLQSYRYLKVSKFQNEFMKSSFLPKYEPNFVRMSALYTYCATLQGRNFGSYFGRNDDFIDSFWNLLTFSDIMLKKNERWIFLASLRSRRKNVFSSSLHSGEKKISSNRDGTKKLTGLI